MEKLKGYLLAILSASSYGLIPYFILPIKKINFSIDVSLFYRFMISALMISLILIYKKESFRLPKKEWFVMIALGIFYALSSDLLFKGYDLLTPGIASTILFAYPIIVAIIMGVLYNEKIKLMTFLALIISFVGILILSAKESIWDLNFIGLITSLGAALFYALYIVTVNKGNLKSSGFKITCYSMFFASVFYGIKSIFWGENLVLPNWQLLWDISLFSLVTTVISTLALVYAIQKIGSTPTSIMGALEPVVAILVSVMLFGELVTYNLMLGVILILVGVILNIINGARKSTSNLSN